MVRRQSNDYLGGVYELPGGGVDTGETIVEGASRELLEETGLVISKIISIFDGFDYTTDQKSHVERFIGTLERECLQWGGVAIDKMDQQIIINQWLVKYHNYRPHQSLNYLTPNKFKARIQDTEVALR